MNNVSIGLLLTAGYWTRNGAKQCWKVFLCRKVDQAR